jgi:4-aminobutyrate aminotransferase-like enzyme
MSEKINRSERDKKSKEFLEKLDGDILCDIRIVFSEKGMMIQFDGKSMVDIVASIVLAGLRDPMIKKAIIQAGLMLAAKGDLNSEMKEKLAKMNENTDRHEYDISDSEDDFIND